MSRPSDRAYAQAVRELENEPKADRLSTESAAWWLNRRAREIDAAASGGAQVAFQHGVAAWAAECFPAATIQNLTERGDRVLEEVLELLQAHGYDRGRVATLVDYVFSRPVGELSQEVGGVMVTLALYCDIAGLDMVDAAQTELARINSPEVMAKIRAKQAAKNALHFDTPLPGAAAEVLSESTDKLIAELRIIEGVRLAIGGTQEIADDYRERCATFLHLNYAALDEALSRSGAVPAQDAEDAARYRLLRRGQWWSVINGIGDELRAEALDAAIDAARAARGGG